MIRRLLSCAVLFGSAVALAAIPTVNVIGTVNTPAGTPATGGTITCVLSPVFGQVTDGTNLQVVASRVQTTLSSAGAVNMNLVPNDQITPANSTYICTYVLTGPVRATWTDAPWSLATSPATINIGAITRIGQTGQVAATPTAAGTNGQMQWNNNNQIEGAPGMVMGNSGTSLTCSSAANDLDGDGTANGAYWSGNAASETGLAITGALAPTRLLSSQTSSGSVSQGYSSAAYAPGSVHVSALAAARDHASLWGDPTYYLQPAVFDTWDDIFLNRPLYADCDNDGTNGGAACANTQPAPAIQRCYNNDCTQDVGFYCITTTDASSNGIVDYDNDGTADFKVGDVVVAGNTSGNTSGGGPTHRIVAITTNGVCGSGNDNAIQVDPTVDQNSAWEVDRNADGIVDTGRGMIRVWKNNTHPTNVGSYHIGYRLGYASRLMYGRQGPNLYRNGTMDWNSTVENMTLVGCTVGAITWSATPATGLVDQDAREGPAYNAIQCATSVTSTDYIESTDAIQVEPGERYVLSGMLMSKDQTYVSLVDDRNNDGTFSDAGDMQYQLSATQAGNQFTNAFAPFWASFEIPVGAGGGGGAVGIHRVKPRFTKGGTHAGYPMLDAWTLRKITTWDTDSVILGGQASSVFLINDPGNRNIVLAGDSWMSAGSNGDYVKQGLVAALLARTGHDYTAQVIPTGASGQSVSYLLDNFYSLIEKYEPLYVVIQIGTNDVLNSTTQANYIARCRLLAQRIMRIGAIPIFMTQAPLGPAGDAKMTTSHNFKDALTRALLN